MVAQNRYVDEVYPHAPWIITEGTPSITQSFSRKTISILLLMMIFLTKQQESMMLMHFAKNWVNSKLPNEQREFQQLMSWQRF